MNNIKVFVKTEQFVWKKLSLKSAVKYEWHTFQNFEWNFIRLIFSNDVIRCYKCLENFSHFNITLSQYNFCYQFISSIIWVIPFFSRLLVTFSNHCVSEEKNYLLNFNELSETIEKNLPNSSSLSVFSLPNRNLIVSWDNEKNVPVSNSIESLYVFSEVR